MKNTLLVSASLAILLSCNSLIQKDIDLISARLEDESIINAESIRNSKVPDYVEFDRKYNRRR